MCFLRKPAVNGIQAASRIMKISLLSMSGNAAKCCVEQSAVAMLLSSAKRVWITSDVLHKIYVSIFLAITIEHLLKKNLNTLQIKYLEVWSLQSLTHSAGDSHVSIALGELNKPNFFRYI